MEISRIKELKPTESAVLIYLIYKGICKARVISRNLEIDICNLYKILKSLEEKELIIKQMTKNKRNAEYKAIEDIYVE